MVSIRILLALLQAACSSNVYDTVRICRLFGWHECSKSQPTTLGHHGSQLLPQKCFVQSGITVCTHTCAADIMQSKSVVCNPGKCLDLYDNNAVSFWLAHAKY